MACLGLVVMAYNSVARLSRKKLGCNLRARGGDSTNWVGINTLKYQLTSCFIHRRLMVWHIQI